MQVFECEGGRGAHARAPLQAPGPMGLIKDGREGDDVIQVIGAARGSGEGSWGAQGLE